MPPATEPPIRLTGPHWDFALAVYGRPGVPETCLALQDGLGLDVNVMLVALYLDSHGVALTPERIAALDAAVAPLRERVVAPLRAVRREAKGETFGAGDPAPAEAVRQAIKKAELMAEQLVQALLARTAAPWPQGAAPSDPQAAVRLVLGQVAPGVATGSAEFTHAAATLATAARSVAALSGD